MSPSSILTSFLPSSSGVIVIPSAETASPASFVISISFSVISIPAGRISVITAFEIGCFALFTSIVQERTLSS